MAGGRCTTISGSLCFWNGLHLWPPTLPTQVWGVEGVVTARTLYAV